MRFYQEYNLNISDLSPLYPITHNPWAQAVVRAEPQTSLKSVKQWDAFHVLLSSGISQNDKQQPTASRKQSFDGATQAARALPSTCLCKAPVSHLLNSCCHVCKTALKGLLHYRADNEQ